jgi:hypothetical protein
MKSTLKLLLLTIIFVVTSCATTTNITGSWKKPGVTSTPFKSIFVNALTTDIPAKSAIENGLEGLFEPQYEVYKSIEAFPPNFESTNVKNPKVMLDKIRTTSPDVIMTVALVDKETEERYVRGTTTYAPLSMYSYYGLWSSYWGYRAPLYYEPGYYVTDKTYFLETNLYDIKTEDLIWSAQSETYNPTDISGFLKGYLKSIEKKMIEDGVIQSGTGN